MGEDRVEEVVLEPFFRSFNHKVLRGWPHRRTPGGSVLRCNALNTEPAEQQFRAVLGGGAREVRFE